MSDFDDKIVVLLGRISARVEEIGAQVTALRAQNSGIVHRLEVVGAEAREACIHARNAHVAVGDLYSLAVDFDDASKRGVHEH
ncbi:MAG: hypothetical protein K8I04_06835 [Gammaproteobacteria bacterium]|nr:hypothetical protein [Gammaproteobacteria bacterium]